MNTIIKNRKKLEVIILSLFVFLAGCSDEKADYINLSYNSFTFGSHGTEEITIEVNASQSWNVDYEGRWVVEIDKNSNSITLGALPTQSGLERTTRVVFRAGDAVEYVNLSQLGTNVSFAQLEPKSPVTMLSPNGKYVGGLETNLINNVYEFTPFVINVATGVRTEKPKIKDDSHVASCVSDEGLLIIVDEQRNMGKYYNGDELIEVKTPQDIKAASITATSSDGRIWVGYGQNDVDRRYYPIKWVNGEPTVLPMPEETLVGTPVDVGAYARGCSADGSVIYGALADDQTGLFWKDDAVEFLGKDKIRVHTIVVNHTGQDMAFAVADRPLFYANHSCMSPNGRYLATTFSITTAPNKNEKIVYYPAYFDFETNTLTYITDLPADFVDGSGIAISDEGILSFGSPAVGYTDAFVYDIHNKTTQTTPDYIKEEYGVTLSNSSLITHLTNQSKTMLGMSILSLGVSYQYWYLNVEE